MPRLRRTNSRREEGCPGGQAARIGGHTQLLHKWSFHEWLNRIRKTAGNGVAGTIRTDCRKKAERCIGAVEGCREEMKRWSSSPLPRAHANHKEGIDAFPHLSLDVHRRIGPMQCVPIS